MYGAGTGTLTPARCSSPGFWTIFLLEEVQFQNLAQRYQIKSPSLHWGVLFGAPDGTLLEFFREGVEATKADRQSSI